MDRPNEKDYYGILGVPRDATLTTIKRAYRRLARKFHPEAGDASPEELHELQAAYETLCDAERRRGYDDSLRRTERTERSDGRFASETDERVPRRAFEAGPLVGEIILSPTEAARGGIIALDVPISSRCRDCGGTGGRALDCARCWGFGTLVRRLPASVHIPTNVRPGAVFQVATGNPSAPYFLLSVQIRPA
jgi:DnaJ-class molecular chaperone